MEPNDFVLRLMQVCGTNKVAVMARAIGVSYQTFKNYMPPINRLPAADILLQIAERTNASIHWLLTGKGPRTVSKEDIPTDEVFELELPTTRLLLRVVPMDNAAPEGQEIPLFRAGNELESLPLNARRELASRLLYSLVKEENPTTKKGKRFLKS